MWSGLASSMPCFSILLFALITFASHFSSAGDIRIAIYFPAFVAGIYFVNFSKGNSVYLWLFVLFNLAFSFWLSIDFENFPEKSLLSASAASFCLAVVFLVGKSLEEIAEVKDF